MNGIMKIQRNTQYIAIRNTTGNNIKAIYIQKSNYPRHLNVWSSDTFWSVALWFQAMSPIAHMRIVLATQCKKSTVCTILTMFTWTLLGKFSPQRQVSHLFRQPLMLAFQTIVAFDSMIQTQAAGRILQKCYFNFLGKNTELHSKNCKLCNQVAQKQCTCVWNW